MNVFLYSRVFPYEVYDKILTHHAVKKGIAQSVMILELEKLPARLMKRTEFIATVSVSVSSRLW